LFLSLFINSLDKLKHRAMNKKLSTHFFAGILLLVSGILALIKGIVEPSERSAIVGIVLLIAAAFLLKDDNRKELMPIRVRARN
jgi:uncharacterized membrane protein HdeD (DUF308 family)